MDKELLLQRLEGLIVELSVAASEDPKAECASSYGTNFENEVFSIHRFCWCEREDCVWCAVCSCPESAFHYFIDDREVSSVEWAKFYRDTVGKRPTGDEDTPAARKAYSERVKEAMKRRSQRHDEVCDCCLGKGIFAEAGADPGTGAPNFWHKPSGLKVWWYKYIGRDMKLRADFYPKGFLNETFDLESIRNQCLDSLETDRAQGGESMTPEPEPADIIHSLRGELDDLTESYEKALAEIAVLRDALALMVPDLPCLTPNREQIVEQAIAEARKRKN